MHPLVSRIHCELFDDGEKVMVRDMASLNGTFVDDTRVADEMAVPSGSRLIVGSAQFYVYYGKDFDNPPKPKAAVQPDAPTKMADETVRMAGASKPERKSAKTVQAPAKSSDSDDFEFTLADDTTPATVAIPAANSRGKTVAAKAAPAKKPRPANPAELADEDEVAGSGRPFVAKGGTAAAAGQGSSGAKQDAKPDDNSGGSGDDDLDNFFKAIM